MKRYGNSWWEMRRFATAFAAIGSIVAVLAFAIARWKAGGLERMGMSLALGLIVFALPFAVVLPTCLFEITMDERYIAHRFLGRYELSRKAIADLRAVEIASGAWGAKLTFRDGSAIRFLGAHLGILARLRDDLRRVAPPGTRFE